MENIVTHQLNWIRSAKFDLGLITGGAFFTLAIAVLSFQSPNLLPIFFWTWIIAFEGSHFWATFSRTYFDPKYFKENKKVLVYSLVFFIFPAICIGLDFQGPVKFSLLYGFFIFCWSLYHNARQHYGFLSIYSHKANLPAPLKKEFTKFLYFGIVFAQLYFLFNFKFLSIFNLSLENISGASLIWLLNTLPLILTIITGILFTNFAFRVFKKIGRSSLPLINFVCTCFIFYGVMFYFIAPQDLFIQNGQGAQKLMLITIMNSLFHNIQYHAIVWHYGQSRYHGEKEYGTANLLNSKTINYLAFSLAMGGLFSIVVWNLGDWPNFNGDWTATRSFTWAYIIFHGIIGHHFYLDQKIWRPSKQKDLKSYLS